MSWRWACVRVAQPTVDLHFCQCIELAVNIMESKLYFLQFPVAIHISALTNIMSNSFVDGHPSQNKLTSCLSGNNVVNTSTVNVCSVRDMLQSLYAAGNTN